MPSSSLRLVLWLNQNYSEPILLLFEPSVLIADHEPILLMLEPNALICVSGA